MAQERSGAASAGNASASFRAAFRVREETRAPPVFGKEKRRVVLVAALSPESKHGFRAFLFRI